MKGIVADLVAGAHGQNLLARRLEGAAVNIAVGDPLGIGSFRIGIHGSQMRGELPPHRLGHRRSVGLEAGQPGAQGAFTGGADFVMRRID